MYPILNKDLAQNIEQSEIDVLYSRLSAIKEIEGNPMGVEIGIFGEAAAFSVKNIPGPSFNTVKGLMDGDEEYLEDIIEFYREKNIPVRFELTPAHVSSGLLSHLAKLGFHHSDFHTSLYGIPELNREPFHRYITVRPLQRNEFELFADIYVKGFEMPPFLKNGVAQNNKVLYENKNWHFYLALYENEPAGIGVLFIKDHIATLAAAATVPHLRNRGVQQALIKERIHQAALAGCELVVGQAKYGSISQINMEKLQLKVAYTKAIWTMHQPR